MGGCASTSFSIPCLTASFKACGFADFLVRQSARHHCVRICERSAIAPEHAFLPQHLYHMYCFLLFRDMCGACCCHQVVCIWSHVNLTRVTCDILDQTSQHLTCAIALHKCIQLSNCCGKSGPLYLS